MSYLWFTLGHGVLFAITIIGLGLPWVPWTPRSVAPDTDEAVEATITHLMLAAALGLALTALGGAAIYLTGLPWTWAWMLPLGGGAGLLTAIRRLGGSWWRGTAVRQAALAWSWMAAWTLGWLALVHSYSGGGWTTDWLEHHERALFFLHRWPADYRFVGLYDLTARPPLLNLVTTVFHALLEPKFATTQITLALAGSLAVWPVWLLARRWRAGLPATIVLAACACNPLWMQNATFAWTKLPTAFLVLAALVFFFRAQTGATSAWRHAGWLLGVASLSHYSALAAGVALAVATLWAAGRRAPWARHRGALAAGGILGGIVLAWLAFATLALGPARAFLASSSAREVARSDGLPALLATFALNLRDTLVPHLLRHPGPDLIAQNCAWGRLRDVFFQLYQVNLLFAPGLVAGPFLLARLLREGLSRSRAAVRTPTADATGLAWVVLVWILVGVAVHPIRDEWGLTHICLQPLVLLGLARVAAWWPDLSTGWRRALGLGATIDVILGVALHFALQNAAGWSWLADTREPGQALNEAAAINWWAKLAKQTAFFADRLAATPSAVPVLWLGACLLLLVLRHRRTAKFGFARPHPSP